MKEITICKGKKLDCRDIYYLVVLRRDQWSFVSAIFLTSVEAKFIPASYQITLLSDSGVYAGTADSIKASDYNFIIDELVEKGIIEIYDDCGTQCIAGINY